MGWIIETGEHGEVWIDEGLVRRNAISGDVSRLTSCRRNVNAFTVYRPRY